MTDDEIIRIRSRYGNLTHADEKRLFTTYKINDVDYLAELLFYHYLGFYLKESNRHKDFDTDEFLSVCWDTIPRAIKAHKFEQYRWLTCFGYYLRNRLRDTRKERKAAGDVDLESIEFLTQKVAGQSDFDIEITSENENLQKLMKERLTPLQILICNNYNKGILHSETGNNVGKSRQYISKQFYIACEKLRKI